MQLEENMITDSQLLETTSN